MSFVSANCVQRRNWNLLLSEPDGNGLPIGSVVYFGVNLTPGSVASGDPLTQKTAMLSSLSSYGEATFEDLFSGDIWASTPALLFGLGGESIDFSYTGADLIVKGLPDLGRFNTTPAGANYLIQNALSATEINIVPSVGTFNAFGLYMTDLGDFLPASYVIETTINGVVYSPGFDVSDLVPMPNGNLVYWGFILSPGHTIDSVKIIIPNTSDVVGIDDIVFGNG